MVAADFVSFECCFMEKYDESETDYVKNYKLCR